MSKHEELFDESIFLRLSENTYYKIVTFVCADWTDGQLNSTYFFTEHERRYSQFCLLGASILGGCLWPEAFQSLSQITYKDIKDVVLDQSRSDESGFWLTLHRNEEPFDCFMPLFLELCLLSVAPFKMINNQFTSHALKWPGDDVLIAPPLNKKYQDDIQRNNYSGLFQRYLKAVTSTLRLPDISIYEYLMAGRVLSIRIYDLDVAKTNVGMLKRRTCFPEEYRDPNLLSTLRNLWKI